jgi:hypothetical protein
MPASTFRLALEQGLSAATELLFGTALTHTLPLSSLTTDA